MCHIILGVGIGGSLPIIYSILGDLFQAEDRNIAAGKLHPFYYSYLR